jgi:hypothetical protein
MLMKPKIPKFAWVQNHNACRFLKSRFPKNLNSRTIHLRFRQRTKYAENGLDSLNRDVMH